MNERALAVLFATALVMNVCVIVISDYRFTTMHEKVHAQICKHDGGSPVTNMSVFGRSETKCLGSGEWSKDLHMMNEVVGYQMRAFMYAMLLSNFSILAVGLLAVYALSNDKGEVTRWGK